MEQNRNKPERPRVWPGMPTPRSQFFESIMTLFPAVVAVLVVLLTACVAVLRRLLGH